MTDAFLVPFGCCVTLLALGGAYIHLRGRYLAQQARVDAQEVMTPQLVARTSDHAAIQAAVPVVAKRGR